MFKKVEIVHKSEEEGDGSIPDIINESTLHNVAGAVSMAKHLPQAVHYAVVAGSAVMQVMAKIVSKEADNEDEQINDDTLLYSAMLLAAAVTNSTDASGRHISTKAGPDILYRALENFEKLTGRKPDEALSKPMVDAAREVGADPAAMAAIAVKRKEADQMGRNQFNQKHGATTLH